MEVKSKVSGWVDEVREIFVKRSNFSSKRELNLTSLKWLGLISLIVFVSVVLLMPDEAPLQFSEKMEVVKAESSAESDRSVVPTPNTSQLWAAPKKESYQGRFGNGGSQVNYNTAMVLGSGDNARTRLHAGVRLPLRILDKVLVSQDAVPVLAELILDSETDSGLKLPAGTRFYGDASFMRGTERAMVVFKQISLPNGQMKSINARALGKDGQGGIPGRVYSDGAKNTAGQVLTSFVGGLAAGSVQTDIFGRSQGGIGNGVLSAVADTARARAQDYGEKLKAEREWIELQPNTECDAQLSESMDLQSGGSHEQ